MFGNKSKTSSDTQRTTAPSQEDIQQSEAERQRDKYLLIEQLAKEKELEVLARAPEFMNLYEKDLAHRLETFTFECQRFGDFLTLRVSMGSIDDKSIALPVKKFSTNVNLANTLEINLLPGRLPDMEGTVRYCPDWGETATGDWGYVVYSLPMDMGMHKPSQFMIEDSSSSGRNQSFYQNCNYTSYVTHGFPRPAADDLLYFKGLGTSLCIPTGKGRDVERMILEEIRRGYELPQPTIINP